MKDDMIYFFILRVSCLDHLLIESVFIKGGN